MSEVFLAKCSAEFATPPKCLAKVSAFFKHMGAHANHAQRQGSLKFICQFTKIFDGDIFGALFWSDAAFD